MKKKIIAVFTGNRAEYGLQFPVLRAIKNHKNLDYRLIVSGAHLDDHFGKTLNEIRDDGFEVHAEIKIDMDAASLYSTAQAIGSGIIEISKALEKMKPDMLVVYADRFEGLAAVVAASQMNIPTAHIEGGDITEGGALDDSVRHAMTKLSHIHFTTNQQASNRILAMGEEDWRVHTVGFPAIDLISENRFANASEIQKLLPIEVEKPIVLFTQHSVTMEFDQAVTQLRPSLEAMEKLAAEGVQVVLTYPNNDAGGRQIIEELNSFHKRGLSNIILRNSLGRHLYHGILGLANDTSRRVVCVGNSSSGLKETPAFNCPTVNIGSRQQGRLRGENVIDASYDAKEIYSAVSRALYDEDFRANCRASENPYWMGDAGIKIAEIISGLDFSARITRKGMTLKGEEREGWFR